MNTSSYTGKRVLSDFGIATEDDLDALVKDTKVFHEYIYTPFDEAVSELHKRWENSSIPSHPHVPPMLKDGFRAVMFRQLITPNFEIRKFLDVAHQISLKPLFWEYVEDKFTSNNEWKHALGKLHFVKSINKNGHPIIEHKTIVDFNTANGKKISTVETLWKEPLIDFHHDFFSAVIHSLEDISFDASQWFLQHGHAANIYYKPFLSLFLKHGVLFENFLLNKQEFSFTRHIFLPAFVAVYQETGYKPLIVPFEPFSTETKNTWMCYPKEYQDFFEKKWNLA